MHATGATFAPARERASFFLFLAVRVLFTRRRGRFVSPFRSVKSLGSAICGPAQGARNRRNFRARSRKGLVFPFPCGSSSLHAATRPIRFSVPIGKKPRIRNLRTCAGCMQPAQLSRPLEKEPRFFFFLRFEFSSRGDAADSFLRFDQ